MQPSKVLRFGYTFNIITIPRPRYLLNVLIIIKISGMEWTMNLKAREELDFVTGAEKFR